jgi:hypothetical protein
MKKRRDTAACFLRIGPGLLHRHKRLLAIFALRVECRPEAARAGRRQGQEEEYGNLLCPREKCFCGAEEQERRLHLHYQRHRNLGCSARNSLTLFEGPTVTKVMLKFLRCEMQL